MANRIMKVPIGIPELDDKFSGIYAGHVTLLTGASGEGREVAVSTALNNYFRVEEQVLAVVDVVALPLRREHVAGGRTAPAGVEALVARPVAAGEECGVGEVHPLDLALGLGAGATDNARVDPLRAGRLHVADELVGRHGGRPRCG